jgi:hypothetical protein
MISMRIGFSLCRGRLGFAAAGASGGRGSGGYGKADVTGYRGICCIFREIIEEAETSELPNKDLSRLPLIARLRGLAELRGVMTAVASLRELPL